MDKAQKAFVAIAACAAIVIIALLMASSMKSKPKIVFVKFEYYDNRPWWGLLTVQNIGAGGKIKIVSYGDTVLYNDYIRGGQVVAIQTGSWDILYFDVIYEDGKTERIKIPTLNH